MADDSVASGPVPTGTRRFGRLALVLAVLVALLCGAAGAGAAWSAGDRADRATAAHRHQVVATTTGRAGISPAAQYAGTPVSTAPASWEYPGHVPRTGTVNARAGTPKGSDVTIWVDDAGAYLPRSSVSLSQRALTAVACGIVAAGAAGLAEGSLVLLARRRALERRLAAWEREWEEVEPVWTGRLRREPGHGDD